MAADWSLKFLFHLVTFAVYVCAFAYDTNYLTLHSGRQTYGGRFKYLTFWNEIIQMVFFGYSVINDLCGTNCNPRVKGKGAPVRSVLQKLRDISLASFVFPTGMFVVLTFWCIYFYDRELIYPKALDEIVPQWLNHMWHTNVMFFLFIEKFLVYHYYPNRRKGLTCTAMFAGIYFVWLFWIAFWADIWVYPVLAVMNWPFRIAFCVGCAAFLIFLYVLGEIITRAIWASDVEVQQKKLH